MKKILPIIIVLLFAFYAFALPGFPPSTGVTLTDSTSTTSSTVAASATAVKAAKDAADARQPTLSLVKGTYTDGYLCKYTVTGTLLDCNIDPSSLGSSIAPSISDGDTTHAPDGNSVFAALALKLSLAGGTMAGHLLFTDNTYDIGATGATRPRTGYFGTSVISPLFSATKTEDTAGVMRLWSDYGTELHGDGFIGSHQTGAMGKDRLYRFPTDAPGPGQMMVWAAFVEETVNGETVDVSQGTWITPNSSDFCGNYLVCQNFETTTTGYDNGESWTPGTLGTGTVTPNDTTATVLRGTQQLKLYSNDVVANDYALTSSPSFTAQDTIYAHFRFKISALPAATGIANIFNGWDGSHNSFKLYINKDGRIGGIIGTEGAAYGSTTTISVDTLYHVWTKYIKGTGSNGALDIYISTTGTKPAGKELEKTNGNTSYQTTVVRPVLIQQTAATAISLYFDQIFTSTSEIGNVP